MAALITVLLLALIALPIILWVHYAKRKEARAQEQLKALAEEMGWQYLGSAAPPMAGGNYSLLRRHEGNQSGFSHLMQGELEGQPGVLFVYTYQIEIPDPESASGSVMKYTSQTVAGFQFPQSDLPPFHLAAQNALHRLSERLHKTDIELSSELSKLYQLQGEDAGAVRAFFTPARQQWIAQSQFRPQVDGAGQWLLIYQAGKIIPADQLCDWLRQAAAWARQLAPAQATGQAAH